MILLVMLLFACYVQGFNNVPVGARPSSMGEAFVSQTGSVYSAYYNPAGLGFMKNAQLSAEYSKLYQGLDDGSDLSNGYFIFGLPLGRNKNIVPAVSYHRFSLTDLYSEETIGFSAGVGLSRAFAIGAGLKSYALKYSVAGNRYYETDPLFARGSTASAYDIDAGICILPFKELSFGLGVNNLLQNSYGLSEVDRVKLVRQDRAGVTYLEEGMSVSMDFVRDVSVLGRESEKTMTREKSQINFGIEKDIYMFALRTGIVWGIDRDYRKITAGLGIKIFPVEIDYAWVFPLSGIEDTSGTHSLSFVVKFAKMGEKEEKLTLEVQPARDTGVSERLPDITTVQKDLIISTSPAASREVVQMKVEISTPAAVSPSVSPVIVASTAAPVTEPVEEVLSPPIAPAVTPTVEVAPVLPPKPKPPARITVPAGPRPGTHKVVSGDTLMSLAEKYYRDKSKWVKIYEANRDKIDKGILIPGSVLVLP
ncbi:MAG: type IX secretion system membrane protein PorP/SprF [Elusimicrobiota bacterium]